MEIKDYKDYVDALCKKYPYLSRRDIKRIVRYGLTQLIMQVRNSSFRVCGGGKKGHCWTVLNRTRRSLPRLIADLKTAKYLFPETYKGCYYFALYGSSAKSYEEQRAKGSGRKRTFKFGTVNLYPGFNALYKTGPAYIFRIDLPYMGDEVFMEDFETDMATLIYSCNPKIKPKETYGWESDNYWKLHERRSDSNKRKNLDSDRSKKNGIRSK